MVAAIAVATFSRPSIATRLLRAALLGFWCWHLHSVGCVVVQMLNSNAGVAGLLHVCAVLQLPCSRATLCCEAGGSI